MIGHLGLSDWVRIDAAGDLDCVGPVATEVLRRHGLLWPCNAYFHAPIFEAAAGGAVLTGVGGDEAFSPSSLDPRVQRAEAEGPPGPAQPQARRLRVLAAVRQTRRDPPLAARGVPVAASGGAETGSSASSRPRPPASRCAGRRATAISPTRATWRYASTASAYWPATTTWRSPTRSRTTAFLAALAALPRGRAAADTHRGDARHWSATCSRAGVVAFDARRSFDEVFWTEHARALVADWDGEGVDPEIVDIDRLRAEWASGRPRPTRSPCCSRCG